MGFGKFQGWGWGVHRSGTDGVLGGSNRCELATVGRSGLGIARSGLASSKLGLSKMEGMRSGGGEKESCERRQKRKEGR